MHKVSELIGRYIDEMNGTNGQAGLKTLGETSYYKLRQLQRMPIGDKSAETLRKQDLIEHCRARVSKDGVCAATVMHDITGLSVVLRYAPSAWDDCEDVSHAVIEAARPMLSKYQLIGMSTPRKRRPADDEILRLVTFFSTPRRKPAANEIIAMPDMIAFAIASSRRIGEICRMTYGDIEWDKKDDQGRPTPMYMIRDLKHPKFKKGNNKRFPLFPELIAIIKRQPRKNADDPAERVFPYRAKSVSAKYTRAKKLLGIENLRFHDNRREAITRWLKLLPPHKVKLISGHETTQILERVYDAQRPEELHKEIDDMLKSVDGQPYNHEPTWRA